MPTCLGSTASSQASCRITYVWRYVPCYNLILSTKVVINSDSSKCFLIKLHIFSMCFCMVLLIFSIYYCLVLPIFSVCLHITVSWYFIEERLLPRDKGWKTYHQRWYVPIRKGLPFTLCLCGWFRRIIFRRVPIQGFESILQVGVQKDFAFAKKKRDSPVTG